MPKPTEGQTWNYLPQSSSDQKLGWADWEKVSLRGSDPPALSQNLGKPEAVGLEQSECNWFHLGRKNCFCWHVSSSTWQRPVCYGKILEVCTLSVGCCPSFIWSIFHTTAVFLTRQQCCKKDFFFPDVKTVPCCLPRTDYLLGQESFSLGAWSQAHTAFGCICQGFGTYSSVWLFASSCSFSYSYICMWKVLWVFCWYPVP